MRRILGVATLAVVALSLVMIGTASAAKPTPPATSGGCPNGSLANYPESGIVGADFEVSGSTTTYQFFSADQDPTNGVPGLVGYCVYPGTAPTTVTTTVEGFDGSAWKASKPGKSFGFTRSGGESSNIPLDGETVDPIGTATWSGNAPATQNILLHISGTAANVCNGQPTCFVRPTLELGPVCDDGAGNTEAAYNAIPTDVEHCSPPSLGFEAWQVAEFGDRVTLDTTGGNELVSMTVDFQSYGCGDSGHWNTGDCVTTGSPTFTVPGGITANIYDPSDPSTPIASATIDEAGLAIPYRPSATALDADCPNAPGDPGAAANSRFKDPISGQCNYSLSVPLTFTFAPGTTFTSGQEVVWTVEFNTTHYGYSPIGEGETCFTSDPGCGYDSLNVGAKSYVGAPYAGTDVNDDEAFVSWGANSNTLGPDSGWAPNRPLGQIVLVP
jgi:hypothetical protein